MTDRLTDAELEAMRGHTQGEWQFHDGYLVRACIGDWCAPIAELRAPYRPNVGIVRGEHEGQANGRLIASAPLMLAELIERRAMDAKRDDLLSSIRLRATLAEADGVHMRGSLRNIVEQIDAALAQQDPTK